MQLIVRRSHKEASEVASQILLGTMYQDHRVNISIAPGPTLRSTYKPVTKQVRRHPEDFTQVHFYSFDNVDVDNHPDGLTGRDLRESFFDVGRVSESLIHLINVDNHQSFMQQLDADGGLDLVFLNLSLDGHFCGNMPGKTVFDARSYAIPAPEIFNETVGLLHLLDGSAIPEYAVTMGPLALLEARHLVLLATGRTKAESVRRLLTSDFDPQFPVSVLKKHRNLTLVTDDEAASLL